MSLLEIRGLSASYGDVRVLSEIDVTTDRDECVSILGANAAGKTTLLKAISGVIPSSGEIRFDGTDIGGMSSNQRVELGLVQVPEGRQVFPFLNVEENLRLGAYSKRSRSHFRETLDQCYKLFPRLMERRMQFAGTLSGGEQQMLAIARGLMSKPKLLMLDEPSMGLAPLLIAQVMEAIEDIHQQGTPVLLVEQNVHQALRVATRGYVLQTGYVVIEGRSEELMANDAVRKAYLGL
jgi:branched-chain amino acid transport system ATP-binding protein